MKEFWILRCPDCGTWRVAETASIKNLRVKCFHCKHSKKVIDARTRLNNVQMEGPYFVGTQAARHCVYNNGKAWEASKR